MNAHLPLLYAAGLQLVSVHVKGYSILKHIIKAKIKTMSLAKLLLICYSTVFLLFMEEVVVVLL